VNIVYAVNDKFAPQVGAGVCSVCENNKEFDKITFYIISHGITDKNKNELKKLANEYGREMNIIELKNIGDYFDFEFDTTGWPPVTLARLLMGEILPKKLEKILYLDGDTIVRGNLKQLWDNNLDNKTIGMSIEPTIDKNRIKVLKTDGFPYCNAGVLLVNLKKWRESNACEKVFDFYKAHDGKLFASDQDAINGALKEEIYILSPKYNFYNIFYQYSYNFMRKLMKPLNYISKDVYLDAVRNPIIIHYLGEERPWRKGNTHKYKSDYKKYLSKTVWKDTPDEEGWNTYFICWRIFNTVTKPFPSLRRDIINSLIPKFMQYRSKKLKKEGSNK
jgi:lipopolysaccharide biosynthesis glycosyltransferase